MLGSALRADEPRSRRKANMKVDPSPARIEGNVNDLPGTCQAERGGEQRHLIQTGTSQRCYYVLGLWAAAPSERAPCQLQTPAAQQQPNFISKAADEYHPLPTRNVTEATVFGNGFRFAVAGVWAQATVPLVGLRTHAATSIVVCGDRKRDERRGPSDCVRFEGAVVEIRELVNERHGATQLRVVR